jgi:hypothetical protein
MCSAGGLAAGASLCESTGGKTAGATFFRPRGSMIDSLLNMMFRCSHRRLTRPVTPVSKAGVPHGETYVVCLDCGKQFAYDLNKMHIGKAIDHSHDACVVPAAAPTARNKKWKYAFWASVPVAAVVVGAVLRSPKGAGKNADAAPAKPEADSSEPK